MRFGSVCSGIEAASVAWGPLGWKAAWLAEIEPFPSAVLAHHYPDVPNLGDMSKLPERILSGEIEAPDIFCGGTPCQAFSVAGLHRSLDDARGNLSLVFCEIANAIDSVRDEPSIIFWENVPGVLNTKDNAFGCFLAGLAGEDDPLEPPGGKWTNAGYVLGPKRAVAWRVTDAQYFGVAQRRRRVFVVASARKGFDPAAVLFEFDGVRRDTAPSREAGEGTAGGFARSVALRGREGGATAELGDDLQNCLRASSGGGDKPHVITMAHGQGGAEIGFDRGPTLTCNHEAPIAAYAIQSIAFSCKDHGADAGPLSPTLRAVGGNVPNGGGQVAVAFAQNSRDEVRLMGGDGQIVGALAAEPGMKQTCYVAQSAVAHSVRLANTSSNGWGIQEEVTHTLDCTAGPAVQTAMQVRRLTPVECERLQGFPDGYSQIPWRNKPASECPDGPRYKALGNSWAVPNVRWIGRRIWDEVYFPRGQQ